MRLDITITLRVLFPIEIRAKFSEVKFNQTNSLTLTKINPKPSTHIDPNLT